MNAIRVACVATSAGPRPAVLIGNSVFDLSNASDGTYRTMTDVVAGWNEFVVAFHAGSLHLQSGSPLNAVTLVPPIADEATIYCAGANYTDHVVEMAKGAPVPDVRSLGLKSWFFIKSRRCAVGHGSVVTLPGPAANVDWEAELAVVIGATAKDVPVQNALAHVAGYTIANDLSARGYSRRTALPESSPFRMDWLAHKNFDGACPIGPWITAAAQVANPQALAIELRVNGAVMQSSNTAQMIYSVAEQISHLSERITLHPGDIVLTGTPAGVGSARGQFLLAGDTVSIEIAGLGQLDTTFDGPA